MPGFAGVPHPPQLDYECLAEPVSGSSIGNKFIIFDFFVFGANPGRRALFSALG